MFCAYLLGLLIFLSGGQLTLLFFLFRSSHESHSVRTTPGVERPFGKHR